MKIKEVITTDSQQQHIDAMKKTADTYQMAGALLTSSHQAKFVTFRDFAISQVSFHTASQYSARNPNTR